MIFLGQASNYSVGDILYHTFAYGFDSHLSELQAFLAAHYGATKDHVALFHNCRSALAVGLKAVIPKGSKVVVNSSTCFAVIQAIKAAGCQPVYADIDKKTLHFGGKELEKALENESNVRAVIVQNNLGIPCDIEAIEKVASERKLILVEDLAHSCGIRYKDGREAGTVGRIVVLSFGKGKAIDTISGGAVILPNPLDSPLAQPEDKPPRGDNLRNRFYPLFGAIIRTGFRINPDFGKKILAGLVKSRMIERSADAKLDTTIRITYWQAALALRQLRQLPRRGRGPIRDFYLVRDREELLDKLENIGVFLSDIWYQTPVAPDRYYEQSGFRPELCPVATSVAKQIINVPTFYKKSELKPALKLISEYETDQDIVEDPVEEAYKQAARIDTEYESADFLDSIAKPTVAQNSVPTTKPTPKPTPIVELADSGDFLPPPPPPSIPGMPTAPKTITAPAAKPVAKPAQKLKPVAKPQTNPRRKPAGKPAQKPSTISMPGMRAAKKKLSPREQLIELKKQQKGGK